MENLQHPLQFDLTLKRLSMTVLLAYIFELPDIKEKMKEVISKNNQTCFPVKSIKAEIIKLASQKINVLELPKKVISEMQGILIFFAKKMATWAKCVIDMLVLDISYLDRIYWTHLGTVDDAKIWHAYWQDHKSFSKSFAPNFDAAYNNLVTRRTFLFRMACAYANKEVILAFQHEMIKDVQACLKPISLPNIENKIDQIVATYLCYLVGESYDQENQTEIFKKFKRTGNAKISEIIFFGGGDPKFVKVLWSFLNNAEKERILIQLAKYNLDEGLFNCRISFNISNGPDTEIDMIVPVGYAETILFLINQMSPVQKNQFLRENVSGVMEIFLQSWPYPELCLKLLREKWICDLISSDGLDVLYTLVFRMARDLTDLAFVSGTCQYPRVFHKLLEIILSLVSKDVKETVFLNITYYLAKDKGFPNAIENFYYIFDLNALSLVINDKDLKKKRDMMINMGSEKISKLIKKGNFKSVLSFMEKVLVSNEERKKFIEKWNLKNHVLKLNNPDILEKVLSLLKNLSC